MIKIAFLALGLISSISLQAQQAEAYYRQGSDLRLQKNYLAAIEYFNLAIQSDSSFTPAYAEKGYCLDNLKKYEEALQAFDRAVVLGTQEALVFLNRGWALYNLGKLAEACQNWKMSEQLGYSAVQQTIDNYCKE